MIKNNFERLFARNCVNCNEQFEVLNLTCLPGLTELFPIYQNNIWTIRQWDDHTIVPPYYIEDCRISRPEVIFRRNDDNKPLRSFFSKDYFTQKSDRNLLHFCCSHRKYF